MPVILYLWWIFSNGMIAYFSIDFFLAVIQKNDRKHIFIFLAINAFLTILVTVLQISGTFWLEILLLIIYAVIFLKIGLQNMLAPVAILFTLRTFMEGFTIVLTAYAAAHWKISFHGILIQIFVSLFFDIIFFIGNTMDTKKIFVFFTKTNFFISIYTVASLRVNGTGNSLWIEIRSCCFSTISLCI